jgi:hypothetical protein
VVLVITLVVAVGLVGLLQMLQLLLVEMVGLLNQQRLRVQLFITQVEVAVQWIDIAFHQVLVDLVVALQQQQTKVVLAMVVRPVLAALGLRIRVVEAEAVHLAQTLAAQAAPALSS